jgi:hypothetical protein
LLELCRAPAVVDEVNAATARAESSLLELCRAPAVVDEVNAATARAESAESLRINDGNPKDKLRLS